MEERFLEARPPGHAKEDLLLDPASHLRHAIAALEALLDTAPPLQEKSASSSRSLSMTQRDELLDIIGRHFDVSSFAPDGSSPPKHEDISNPEPSPQKKWPTLPRSPSLVQRDELLTIVDRHFDEPTTPQHVLLLEGFMVHDAHETRVYPRLLIPFSIRDAPREVAHLLYDQLIFKGTEAVRVPFPPWGASPTPYLLSPTREEAKFIYTTWAYVVKRMKQQLPPHFHTKALLAYDQLVRQCHILRGHPDESRHPQGTSYPLEEDLRAHCPRPNALPFTQYILPPKMKCLLDVYRLAGYRTTGIVGDPHSETHGSPQEDIEPPPSFACPYHRLVEPKTPITSHGLWGSFRPIGQPQAIPKRDCYQAPQQGTNTQRSRKWHKRQKWLKHQAKGKPKGNLRSHEPGTRRAPSRRCTRRQGSNQFQGASLTGHPRFGKEYQARIPEGWSHPHGR